MEEKANNLDMQRSVSMLVQFAFVDKTGMKIELSKAQIDLCN